MTAPAGGITPVSTRVMNLATLLTQVARRDPDGIALVMGDARWTWAAFDARTDALAAGLQRRLWLQKGDNLVGVTLELVLAPTVAGISLAADRC